MTNSKQQNKYQNDPLKLEPIIRGDKGTHLNDEMLNPQPNIPANETSFKQYSWSFALRLLHDQLRNVTLPASTGQFMPYLSLKLSPCEASPVNTNPLYHIDLSVEIKDRETFFVPAGVEHICFHHIIESGKYTGAEFYPDALNPKMTAAFVNAAWHPSGKDVDKATS